MTEAYTGIVPNQRNLRRFQGVGEDPPSPDPQISPDSGRNNLRSYLDDVFNIPDDPYTSWNQKRDWLARDSRRQMPNISDRQLDQVYKAYGLSRSPGDFDRGEDTWGAFSRSMDMAGESVGQVVDAAQMKLAAKLGDDAGVAENQRQLDESRWEQSLIAQFQSERSNGPLSQFLFDLSSSAPLMVGMVVGGAALAGVASFFGAPVWLAGMLGYGVIDALIEGQFTFIDVVTDPHVRGKIEKALGREMSDNDIKAISKETQRILMERAAVADDEVKIVNFMNPLNYVPFANKLNKLFKAGSAMKGTVLRGATNVAFREGIEEVGQSALSQRRAGEAKIDLLTRYGEDPDPKDYDIDWGQAFYEGAMGFVTGAPIGMVSSYRGGKAYKEGRANIDEETGQLIYKDKNQENFTGKGPIELEVRSIVDSQLPLADKLYALDEFLFRHKDGREAEIIRKEIQRMKEGKPLMFDKADQEKLSRRQQAVGEFKKGTHFDPKKDREGKPLADVPVGQEVLTVEPDQKKHTPEGYQARVREILSEVSQSPGVQAWMKKFLNFAKDDRTPFQKQYIQFALDPANNEINAQELIKLTNQRINELFIPDKYGKSKSELAEEEKISEVSKETKGFSQTIPDIEKTRQEELNAYYEGGNIVDPIFVHIRNQISATRLIQPAEVVAVNKYHMALQKLNLSQQEQIDKLNKKFDFLDIKYQETEIDIINAKYDAQEAAGISIRSPITTTVSTRQAGETVPGKVSTEGITTEGVTTEEVSAVETAATPTISDKITDKSKARTEIINTWKAWWAESKNEPKTDEQWKKLNSDISKKVNAYGKKNYETLTEDKVFETEKEFEEAKEKGKHQYEDWKFTPEGRTALARDLAEENGIPIPPVAEQTTFPGTATGIATPTGPEVTKEEAESTTEVQPDEKPIQTLYNIDNEEAPEVLSIADVMNKTVMHFTPNKTNRGASFLLTTDQYDAVHRGADKVKQPTEKMSRNDYNMTRYTFTGMVDGKADGDPIFTSPVTPSDLKVGETFPKDSLPPRILNRPNLAKHLLAHLRTGKDETFVYPQKTKNSYSWRFLTPKEGMEEAEQIIYEKDARKLHNRIENFNDDLFEFQQKIAKVQSEHKDNKGKIKNKTKLKAALAKHKNEKKKLAEEAEEIEIEKHRIGYGVPREDKAQLQTRRVRIRKAKASDKKELVDQITDAILESKEFQQAMKDRGVEYDAMSDSDYSEALGDSITRRDTGRNIKDEPQAAELKKTAEAEAKLQEKRDKVAAVEATREQDAVEKDMVLENWRKTAAKKMAKYSAGKTGRAGIKTEKALQKLRSVLEVFGDTKNRSDKELLEFLWNNEGTKKGMPNVVVVGEESAYDADQVLPINNVPAKLKAKKGETSVIKVYSPNWESGGKGLAPYGRLADLILKSEAKTTATPTKKAKAKPETTTEEEYEPPVFTGTQTVNYDGGDRYEGEWKDGKYNGQGTYTYSNGDFYKGEWKNDLEHGQGTWESNPLFAPTNKYVGKWKDGDKHGKGTFTYDDGDKFIGEWKDDKKWTGSMKDKDGNVTQLYSKGKATDAKTKKTTTKAATTEKTPAKASTSAEILAELKKGSSVAQVAKKYNLGQEFVRNIWKKSETEKPPVKGGVTVTVAATTEETKGIPLKNLTRDQLKALLAQNGKEDLISKLDKDTKYSDLTAWDSEEYTSSEDFANQIKNDLGIPLKKDPNYNPKTDKAPTKLMEAIRKRLFEWLKANLGIDENRPLAYHLEVYRAWRILNVEQRTVLAKIFDAKDGGVTRRIQELHIKNKDLFDVKKKAKVIPPKQEATTTPLSKVAVSATTRVPFKKQKGQRVWWILPSEVTSLFGGMTQDFADSLDPNAPFIITDVQNTWRMYTINTSTGLINPKAYDPPTELTTGAKGLHQNPANLASRKDPEFRSKKLTDDEISQLNLMEGTEFFQNRMMDEGLLPFLKLRSVDRKLDDIENTIKTVPGDQLWATDYGNKTVEFVESKGDVREHTTIRFKTDKGAKEFVERIRERNSSSSELEQVSFSMTKAQQFKIEIGDLMEDASSLTGSESSPVYDAENDQMEIIADDIAQNRKKSIFSFSNNIGWDASNNTASIISELNKIKDKKDREAAIEAFREDYESGQDIDVDDLQYLATKSDTVTLSVDAKKPTIEQIKDVVFQFNKRYPGIINKLVLIIDPNHPVSKDKRGIKGAYSTSKDTIYLVAHNLASKEDVAMTLFHEGVGHRSYKNPKSNILTDADRAELEDLVKNSFPEEYTHEVGEQLKHLDNKEKKLEPGLDRDQTVHTRAAQEVFAHKIETMTDEDFNPTFVERLSAWIRKVLRNFLTSIKLGTVLLNDNDVKVLFSRLAKDLKKVAKPMSELDTGSLSTLPEDLMYRADLSLDERFKNHNVTNEQAQFLDQVYPVYDKVNPKSIMKSLWQAFNHKVFDPYLVIRREIGIVPYMKARLAGRSDGMLTALLQYSAIKVEKERVDGKLVNQTVLDRSKKGFNAAIKALGTESERQKFFAWLAAKRASILKAEDPSKEQYFSDESIRRGLTLNTGVMKDASTGREASRQQIYNMVANDIAALNESIVKLGIDMGLFNAKSAKQWQTAFYVPFYRHFEEQIGDNQFRGAANYNSMVNQRGVYELHGSEKGITDPHHNLLHNWLHIIDASIKNDSATVTMDAAVKIIDPVTGLPMVQKVSSPNSRSVRILRDGKEEYYVINNKLLFDSLTTLSNDTKFPMFGLGIKAKTIFTRIITSSPVFKFWSNIIRDTVGAAGTTDVGFNLWKNAVGGYRSLSDVEGEMLVTGGYIQFGNIRVDDPKYAEKILGKELTSGYVVNNPETNETFQSVLKKAWKMAGSAWRQYERLGDKMENANRAAIFTSTLAKNKSKLEAAFESRDLMDFTLHGGSTWVRTLTSLTPFLNAMIQGKYKLARSMKEHPEAVVTLAGMTVLVSLFEYFMWGDDERWDARPDWDKDSYFWVKLPGTDTIFKIPKPHEFAMVGNLAWRGIENAKKKDPVHGELLASAIRTAVFREFDNTPLPHFLKPFLEIGMNENFFFNKPIESKGMQYLSPENRKSMYTSDTAGLISGLLQHIPDILPYAENAKLSPVQVDHVANAYFAYVGGLVFQGVDLMLRAAGSYPDRPARPITEHSYIRKILQSANIRSTKYGAMFYERLVDAEQAYADLKYFERIGDMEKYREIYKEKRDLLAFRKLVKGRRRDINDLDKRIKQNTANMRRSAESKAVIEDRLYQMRNRLFKIITMIPGLR